MTVSRFRRSSGRIPARSFRTAACGAPWRCVGTTPPTRPPTNSSTWPAQCGAQVEGASSLPAPGPPRVRHPLRRPLSGAAAMNRPNQPAAPGLPAPSRPPPFRPASLSAHSVRCGPRPLLCHCPSGSLHAGALCRQAVRGISDRLPEAVVVSMLRSIPPAPPPRRSHAAPASACFLAGSSPGPVRPSWPIGRRPWPCHGIRSACVASAQLRSSRIQRPHPPQSAYSPWPTSQPAAAPARFLARRSGPVSACHTPAPAWRTDRRQDLLTGVDSDLSSGGSRSARSVRCPHAGSLAECRSRLRRLADQCRANSARDFRRTFRPATGGVNRKVECREGTQRNDAAAGTQEHARPREMGRTVS